MKIFYIYEIFKMSTVLLWYFILINTVSFVIWALDKKRALYQQRRISEHHLLILSLLG